jgi:hypothetical protein
MKEMPIDSFGLGYSKTCIIEIFDLTMPEMIIQRKLCLQVLDCDLPVANNRNYSMLIDVYVYR